MVASLEFGPWPEAFGGSFHWKNILKVAFYLLISTYLRAVVFATSTGAAWGRMDEEMVQ